jgi:predicted GIY-YIG superfamily endonuclease
MNQVAQLPLETCSSNGKSWPYVILIEPGRLACGLWGYGEGDIYKAYCADTFPKIRTFLHEGQVFTNCGGTSDSMDCYPLIPAEGYAGPEQIPYSYEGRQVMWNHRACRLGPKIRFAIRERTVDEETDLLRRQYAHGGYFAAGKTYRQLLLEYQRRDNACKNLVTAINAELAMKELPDTQKEMLAQLDGPSLPEDAQQGLLEF